MHRLSGADGYVTFDTWQEAKSWIGRELRTSRRSAEGKLRALGPCADSLEPADGPMGEAAERAPRYTYTGLPTQLVAPVRSWHTLDRPLAEGQPTGQKWVVCYTRDRAEFPNLKWRLVEASSRVGLQQMLDAFLDQSKAKEHGALPDGGEANEVWTVQSVAAELCTRAEPPPQATTTRGGAGAAARGSGGSARVAAGDVEPEALEGGGSLGDVADGGGWVVPADGTGPRPRKRTWVRWVAVLRAGGIPPTVDGVPTNAEQRCEWAVEETRLSTLRRLMTQGFELCVTAGTPPVANGQFLAFSRLRTSWAPYETRTEPHWPAEWVTDRQEHGFLIVSVSYCAEAWTVTMAQPECAPASSEPGRRARQFVFFEPWLPAEPPAYLHDLLRAGYHITALSCGPRIAGAGRRAGTLGAGGSAGEGGAGGLPSTYVLVLTKCPNLMLPLTHRGKGSFNYKLRMQHLLGERCWHVDWTKHATCRVHASTTGKEESEERGLLQRCCLARGGRAEAPPVTPRASYILDGDESTYWRSALIEAPAAGVEPPTETLTLDLGEVRAGSGAAHCSSGAVTRRGMHACTHAYAYAYTHTHTHTHIRTHARARMHAHARTHAHACTRTHAHP